MEAKDTVMNLNQLKDEEEKHLPDMVSFNNIAKDQAEISFKLRTEDILRQLNEFNNRGLTITEAITLLQ